MKVICLLTAVFLQFWMSICSVENQCQFWESVPLSLKDLEGTWYGVAFINDTDNSEKMSCLKMNLKYHPENDSATEYTTAVRKGTNEPIIINAELQMPTPGILDQSYVVNNTKVQFHDYFVEFTKGESYITALCEIINGTKTTDKLSIFFKEQHVEKQQILLKLKSLGVKVDNSDEYYHISQDDCPN